MYLSYLKPFQKESFLDLSLMIANADHEFNVLEKDLIKNNDFFKFVTLM